MPHNLNRPALLGPFALGLALALAGCAESADPGTAPPVPPVPAVPVQFHYQPLWAGVSGVDVVGGFGRSSDWTQPLVHLTQAADGSFTGSAELVPGQYPYLFAAQGDSNAGDPAGTRHYSLDPENSALVSCPPASPTYAGALVLPDPADDTSFAARPCSQLHVAQAATPTLYEISGQVTWDAQPAPGYLVVLEHDDDGLYPYFTNMMVTRSDGSYSFLAAPGQYRVQVKHPTLERVSDAARDPLALQAVRRAISASFPVTAGITLGAIDTAFHGYGQLAVPDPVTLPASFAMSPVPGGSLASLAIYGLASPSQKNVGAAWFVSARTGTASVAFDGAFNAPLSPEAAAVPGEGYYFGLLQTILTTAQPAKWTLQSMVLPIAFQ